MPPGIALLGRLRKKSGFALWTVKTGVRARARGSASSIIIAEGGQVERPVIPNGTVDLTSNQLEGGGGQQKLTKGERREEGRSEQGGKRVTGHILLVGMIITMKIMIMRKIINISFMNIT